MRPPDLPPPEHYAHGTRARYVSGCRCPPCRASNVAYYHERQRRGKELAAKIGLRPEWAQRSSNGILHYDLTPFRRNAAVAAGARELNHRRLAELVRRQRVVRRFPFPQPKG